MEMIDLDDYRRLAGPARTVGEEVDLQGRLNHAKLMYGKAFRSRDKKAMSWWKTVYHNTKKALKGSGSSEAPKSAGAAASGEHGSFLKALGAKSKAALAAFKSLPKSSKRFFADKSYRKQVARDVASSIRKKASHAVDHVKEEALEFKDAGKALSKLAQKKELTNHEKTAIKKAAKAVAVTVVGTVALGGLSHLTVAALAKHFAAETAAKAVAKAAVMSSLMRASVPFLTEDEITEQVMESWVKNLVNSIADEMEKLGNASPEEMASLLTKIG